MLENKIEKLIEESLQLFVEAGHINHPWLSKYLIKGGAPQAEGIQKNRDILAKEIRQTRKERDSSRKEAIKASVVGQTKKTEQASEKANLKDNAARYKSITGGQDMEKKQGLLRKKPEVNHTLRKPVHTGLNPLNEKRANKKIKETPRVVKTQKR